MKRLILLALPCLTLSAYAMTPLNANIKGNPIDRQDDYTINANVHRWADVTCVFTNAGLQKADLEIWTSPHSSKPNAAIHLKKASMANPYQVTKQFHLELKKHWWCRIYTPKNQKNKWHYCSFFSIADATISEYTPFGNFNKTIHSKTTTYQCQIKKPNPMLRFFYFK